MTQPAPSAGASRRQFLTASAAVAGGAVALGLAPHVHAFGGEPLKVGLIGCGGRGTGAAANALAADPDVKLYALADAFPDKFARTLTELRKDPALAKKIDVAPERCFAGFTGYKDVIAACDVVLLCTPPHFRPAHLRAAVEAGKHVFCEKPVAVDAPGVRSVLESAKLAAQKKIVLVSGLCYRYEHSKREVMKRVHAGDVGDIVALHTNYNAWGLWYNERQPGWSDMEYQLRNWLYYTWLSGDHNVEQHIHSLDKMAWAMQDRYPVKCVGLGGRQARTDPKFGCIFDHHAVVYEWDSGVKLFAYCRQQDNTYRETSDFILGTKGTASVMGHAITGDKPWKHKRDPKDNMYQNEHDELFAAIRAGKVINNGEYMAHSTLMAIMGRMATYTGQQITWEQALNSQEDLSPEKYEFGPMPVAPVAVPGKTKFV